MCIMQEGASNPRVAPLIVWSLFCGVKDLNLDLNRNKKKISIHIKEVKKTCNCGSCCRCDGSDDSNEGAANLSIEKRSVL